MHMDLHASARRYASGLPAAGEEQPFGPDWDVFKVAGKVFMLMTERNGSAIVTMKASPEEAVALRTNHSGVTPGYHMNKKHWVTVHPGSTVRERELHELIRESYRLVVANLPRARRPVDPVRF